MAASHKLLTIVVEAVLERRIAEDLELAGVRGFTTVEARGVGSHGHREGDWEQSRSVRIESVCDAATAGALARRLLDRWGEHYAMVLWLHDVEVLRGSKFEAAADRGPDDHGPASG